MSEYTVTTNKYTVPTSAGEYTVTTSAELMENYIQADFLQPQKKFTALQTDQGASLLFSIGTEDEFYLTMEVPGETNGWRQVNLSAAQVKADIAGRATVKTFGAAQAVPARPGDPAQIHLAMVLHDGTNDQLYLSLRNSDSDLSWAQQPVWTPVPFNAVDSDGAKVTPPSPFQIVNVQIGEATDREHIVVDIIRNPDPDQSAHFITRYFIDTFSDPSAPPTWTLYPLSVDVQADSADFCLGRSAPPPRRAGTRPVPDHPVDGIYTKGGVGSSAQLIYTPLYNWADTVPGATPPQPTPLKPPGGAVPDAIAAARNPDGTSDLYVATQGSLYWFKSDNQTRTSDAVKVVTSPLLAAVENLYAYTADGSVTVWGLNHSNEVFYLTCRIDPQQRTIAALNVPLTILTDVDAISPFIDRNYSANTFFAHSATRLVKVVKSPTTGLWSSRNITLPPAATTHPATPIHSYTTHIQVTDSNGQPPKVFEINGQPAPKVTVTLTATNVTSVYINHLYYLIGPLPIHVTPDTLGTITIVELTESLAATRYQISISVEPPAPSPANTVEPPASIHVNTMDTAWQRNAKYTTVASLQSAKIVDRDGSTRNFVPTDPKLNPPTPVDLQGAAQSNQVLADAYRSLSSAPTPPAATARVPAPAAVRLEDGSSLDGTLVDLGDLFSWLASGAEAVIKAVKEAADDVWHLIVTIEGEIFRAVLDCVEAVVAAATWVYNKIRIAVEDVIKFLEFVFGWQDILVTHQVLKNVFLCLGRSAIDGIAEAKQQINTISAELQGQIGGWAHIPDFTQTASATVAANPPANGQNSAPANLGVHHFQGNAAASSSTLSPDNPVEAILNDLVKLLDAEGGTLSAAADAIQHDIIEQFSTLTVTDVVNKTLAIVAKTVLKSTENVLVTVLDIFAQLVQGVIDVLTAKLDIPVLSWLYHDLTGEDLSFLDVICLVAAIPVTIIYKAATAAAGTGKAPFPADDPFTIGLRHAQNLDEIRTLFIVAPATSHRAPATFASFAAADSTATTGDDAPVVDQEKLKNFGFITGIASLVGAALNFVVTSIQRTLDLFEVDIYRPKTLATLASLCNILVVSPNIESMVNAKTDNWYANFNNILTGFSILTGLAAIPAAASKNPTVKVAFGFVVSFTNALWTVPVIANIVVNHDAAYSTYKSLIPESIGNFAVSLGGILEGPIVLALAKKPSNPQLVAGLALAQALLMGTYGVCMIIAGSIYYFAPDQQH
jgi:hypothetical protein